MPANDPTVTTRNCPKRVKLARAIERQIVQRTWGRIHRLRVEVNDGHVVVHGRTGSYYVKQLALAGVLDVLDSPAEVEMNVEVEASRRH